MKKSKTYIHVNQHVIRANKKHGTMNLLLQLNKVKLIDIVTKLKS
jgi:hypothetical protein